MKKIITPILFVLLLVIPGMAFDFTINTASTGTSLATPVVDITTSPMQFPAKVPSKVFIEGASSSLAIPVVESSPVIGPLVLATYTVSFAAGAAKVNLDTLLPDTAHGFELKIWGDDLVFGSTNMATGTFYVGYLVSSGSSRVWTGGNTGFYMAPRMGLVATVTISGW